MIDLKGNSYTMTEIPSYIEVGKYSSIGSDCIFPTGGTHLAEVNHKCVFTTHYDQTQYPEPVIIGNDVWIGQGVRILPGVTIGNGAIIGAGAVIAKNVPAYAVVVGNPQEIKRMRFTTDQIVKLEQIKWWEWEKPIVFDRLEDMKDIDVFLKKYA